MQYNYLDKERIDRILTALEEHLYTPCDIPTELLYREGRMDTEKAAELSPFGPEDTWGGYDMEGWFRAVVDVPADWAGQPLWLMAFTGREGRWNADNPQLLAYVNGQAVQGLDTNHTLLPFCGSGPVTIDLDAWSGMVREDPSWSGEKNLPAYMKLRVCQRNEPVWDLYYDIKVPLEVAQNLPEDSYDAQRITRCLRKAVNLLDLQKPGGEAFLASVTAASNYLDEELYGQLCGSTQGRTYCVGHTHIDVAWLWRYAHTRRKAARSFATAQKLADEYPDFVFMSSQPQLYQFVKQDHPALYERIRQLHKEGRWEVEGGMWLEADCNLSSGESLIRQFVHGKGFMKEEFGVDSRILWLPDVFGYSAALPQICKKCGIDYFMTIKIGWNETNKMPFDTFTWKGIDGSEILVHFPPAPEMQMNDETWTGRATYNAMLRPRVLVNGWKNYKNRDVSDSFMITYGYGDGGGGPTRDMVEQLRRMERGIPGCPVAKPAHALEFFEDLERQAKASDRLPKFYGELYLEYHRGTYTSIAKNKKNNRQSEFLLQCAEAMASQAALWAKGAPAYPAKQLHGLWERVLLNQFHDVLPGSSIEEVYLDTDVIYAEVRRGAGEIIDRAQQAMADQVRRAGDSLVVFNQLGNARGGLVRCALPAGEWHLEDGEGNLLPVQTANEGGACFHATTVPGMGYAAFALKEGAASATQPTLQVDGRRFSNGLLEVCFDENGEISSLIDLEENRQLIPQGARANSLETYEDLPLNFDAWDINYYHKEKRTPVQSLASFEVMENGPVRAVLRLSRRYLGSDIRQDIVFYPGTKRMDFETEVDWKEEHILLKTAFPVDILSPSASYEIQYGVVQRPTHGNTSWDMAQFEVCAHKWADYGDYGYGVSLLNDCKYGHDIHDGVMRLTLLKSATYPSRTADRELHRFTYSLLPHTGGYRQAGTIDEAYDLNAPLQSCFAAGSGGALPSRAGMAQSGQPGIRVDVLKGAEDGEGYILRAWEAFGRRTQATIALGEAFDIIQETDMLENPEQDQPGGQAIDAVFGPYEIKTFRLAKGE